ncbi:MAG: lytic murein transglycosylase B [Gammaproteobacteria bacterium]|nr:lytic murein transglycosylase B [Gammaproteobacteria bacterium]
MTIKKFYTLLILWLILPFAISAKEFIHIEQSFDTKKQHFINEINGQFGYTDEALQALFQQIHPDKKILAKISRPAEKTTPWFKYQKIFADKSRLTNGVKFYQQHQATLQQAYEKYGVPPSIIVAIIGVETRYGKIMGKDKVIQALSTIGFGYPKREKFFTKELKSFLQMCAENQLDPLSLRGSYAGAMGMAQFMPSSYLHYSVDYDGDGKRDLWHNPDDAIFSVANYLAENGWQRDEPITDEAMTIAPANYQGKYNHKPFTTLSDLNLQGFNTKTLIADSNQEVGLLKLAGKNEPLYFITFNNFSVITTYNTSPMYAMAVFNLAKSIESQLTEHHK